MNNIVRAWKDEAYPQSLSAWEQAILPAKPASEIELTDTELDTIYGAYADQEDLNVNQQRAVNTFDDGRRVVMTSTVSRSASDSDEVSDYWGHPAATIGLGRGICRFW